MLAFAEISVPQIVGSSTRTYFDQSAVLPPPFVSPVSAKSAQSLWRVRSSFPRTESNHLRAVRKQARTSWYSGIIVAACYGRLRIAGHDGENGTSLR